jgi:acetylornithine deacetylase/succinyl-diaminopimelate desuccinylase-like protein
MTLRLWLFLLLALMASPEQVREFSAGAVARLAGDVSVRRALDTIRRVEPDTIDEQIRLCEIPAPPFGEAARAAAYADAMRRVGLRSVRIDREGNVLGERPGRSAKPHLVLSAHLDTVFPAEVPTRVTREGRWLHGPGIGDDCRGLAVVLAVARVLNDAGISTEGPMTFVGTVGEEGLGDLRGVKALVGATLKGRIDRFVSVDGDGYGITHVGVGSRRHRVTFTGPGGHSYDDFGRANPITAMSRAAAAIAAIPLPTSPRTTVNVGRVGGGTSVNAIAADAWMEVDVRSSDTAVLDQLDARSHAAVGAALAEENTRRSRHDPLTVSVALVGNRPAGRTDLASPVVQAAASALGVLGLPVRFDERSTDANLPMSVGVPSITVGGGGIGRDAHSARESFDTTDSWRGTQFVLLLAVALAN